MHKCTCERPCRFALNFVDTYRVCIRGQTDMQATDILCRRPLNIYELGIAVVLRYDTVMCPYWPVSQLCQ